MMKRSYIISFFLVCIASQRGLAQHYNIYSNYLNNLSAINAAAIGKDEALDVSFYSRKQWTGFNGSPLTTNLAANAMLKKPSENVGIFIQNDRIGVASNYYINGQYAYRVKFKTFKLSFGLSVGVQILNNNTEKLRRVTEADVVVDNSNLTQYHFSNGAGVFAHNKLFFGGISVPFLYSYKGFNINETPVYVLGGLMLNTVKKDFVKPSFMIRRISGSQISFDLNVNYYFMSQFGAGISYRHKSAIVGMLEYKLNEQFKVAYCYDYSTSAISKFQTGSHEISLRYLFGKKYITNNPRVLNF